VLCALALSGLLVGGWFWFRDSPLTSASHVTVVGASGPDAARIQDALKSTAHTMSTLDVDTSKLRGAVAPYPIVKDIDVTTRFPHEVRIHVVEQLAVAAIDAGSRKTAVAADGTLLHDVVVSRSLPLVPMRVPPGGARVTDSTALGAIRLLAAAPARLRAKVTQVSTVSGHGLVAQLQNGPAVYFGDTSDLRAKWLAAAAVLADAGSTGAAYIDVTDPRRPAAGSGPNATTDQSATGSTTATSPDSSGSPAAAASSSASPSGG
jgi:cell division protein FtsQ